MASLADKTLWPIGTRVVYAGKSGEIPCVTISLPHRKHRTEPRRYVYVQNAPILYARLHLDDLELAPARVQVGVRWKLVTSKYETVTGVTKKGARYSAFDSKRDAIICRRYWGDPTLVLVRITTFRVSK